MTPDQYRRIAHILRQDAQGAADAAPFMPGDLSLVVAELHQLAAACEREAEQDAKDAMRYRRLRNGRLRRSNFQLAAVMMEKLFGRHVRDHENGDWGAELDVAVDAMPTLPTQKAPR